MRLNSFNYPGRLAACKQIWTLALCVAVFLLFYWAQTIYIPYWQDDYNFLLDAHKARIEGKTWLAPFSPETKVYFWRPLGMETYWRFIDSFLNGNVVAAHISNILLLFVAAAAVGRFVATFIGLLVPGKEKAPAAIMAAFLYGIHSAHFLPAAWVAAANDSFSVIFSALALHFWLIVTTDDRHKRWGAAFLVIMCTLLALLSRDIAFVLPPLGLLLVFWLWPRYKPTPFAVCTGLITIGVCLSWLMVRNHFTAAVDPAYEMRFGANLLRNAGCLFLFAFNTPFESLRYFFFVKASFNTAAWGIACFLLQAASFGILFNGARQRLGKRGAVLLVAFFIIGCAPYFLLNFNCYPYYTSLALMSYALLAGLSSMQKAAFVAMLSLSIASSAFSTLGNYFFDSPSHIGRARWAEKQLVQLTALKKVKPQLFITPLYIIVEDNHKFLGFKSDGLAYRLGIDKKDIVLLDQHEQGVKGRTVLVVPKDGDVYFR